MTAEDKPGVLSNVASICSAAGVSIEALIQKEPAEGETRVPLIILTNRTREGELNRVAEEIEALDSIEGRITRIRVETLDG
jgi:homoserine dehydrogenase